MTEQELKHIGNNIDTINVWIETNQNLQPSNDILLPITKAYERETKNSTLACKDCLIDALVWARMEWKKTNPEPKKTEVLKKAEEEKEK